MLELKALLLTQGMHGMLSQVEGLAKALNLSFKHHKIKLKPLWNLIPPKFTPIIRKFINRKICFAIAKMIISCAEEKALFSAVALKKRFGKEIFNIHIQDPKVSFEHFDLIISPKHDSIEGDNVITTNGAIHYLTKKEITDNSNYLKIRIKKKRQIVAFIIGGPNKKYNYSEEQIHYTFNKVKTLFTPDKFKIVVVPSYRTPERVIKKAFNTFNFNHYVVRTVDKKAYLSSFGNS